MRALLACLLLFRAAPTAAQQTFDRALTVQQGGKEIGREDYSVRPGTRTGASVITARSRYPALSPTLQLGATQERAADGSIAKFELDVQAPEGNVVILAAGSGARLIVRSVSKGSEAGRELPGGRDLVLLDDRVFSLYLALADVATPAGARVTAVFPRGGRRATIVARRESGPSGATIQLSGDVIGTLTVDPQGRFQRLELPSTGIVVSPAAK
ncbi:MAG TPA: hypothetical protein VIE46_11200 [Gemmatimonadales bacterium]|jgi:hypothetical protein